MARLFISTCASGDVVEDVFVVTNKQFAATATGKFFIKAFVSDRSGQITARMWNATRDIFNAIPESGFLRLRGRVENYQNNLQFIIEQMWPAKAGSFDVADLVPHTEKDIPAMFTKLTEILGSIQNRHLAALVQAYLDDAKLMDQFRQAPAAMTFHHAFIGGLLEHTLNAVEVADAIVKFYPGLNRDLVIAGIFLHDIAKTWELTYQTAFGYSDGGQLVGHIVKSAIWVEEKAKAAEAILGEPIPRPLIDVIQHIILSHHGEAEFGSPKTPATPEAIAVHVIENLDAKMMMALGATRGEGAASEGNWTEWMKQFGGRMFKPDVAPADAPVVDPSAEAPDSPASSPSSAARDDRSPPTLKMTINNPLFESSASPKKK